MWSLTPRQLSYVEDNMKIYRRRFRGGARRALYYQYIPAPYTSAGSPSPTSTSPAASTAVPSQATAPWLLGAQTRALQDVFKGFDIPDIAPHARRAWYHPLTEQERAVMVLNFLKSCGFDSLGEFLTVVFGRQEGTHRVVAGHARTFLDKSGRAGTHPIDVVRLWYHHPRCEKYTTTGAPQPVSLPSLPRYARPRSERLQPELPTANLRETSTRTDIADWALSEIVMPGIDKELKTLQNPAHRFVLRKSSELKWEDLLSLNAAKAEDTVATQTPPRDVVDPSFQALVWRSHNAEEASAANFTTPKDQGGTDSATSIQYISAANDSRTKEDTVHMDPKDSKASPSPCAPKDDQARDDARHSSGGSASDAARAFSEPHMYDPSTHLHHALTEEHWREYMEPWNMNGPDQLIYIPNGLVGEAYAFDADLRLKELDADPRLKESHIISLVFPVEGGGGRVEMYVYPTSSLAQVYSAIHEAVARAKTGKKDKNEFCGLQLRRAINGKPVDFDIIGGRHTEKQEDPGKEEKQKSPRKHEKPETGESLEKEEKPENEVPDTATGPPSNQQMRRKVAFAAD
ncbi:hypothetical protein C8T65DRAFT_699203 [Cerioporus squamosus]|nr:hypothetical protein C8T65DRAFT_699203 [Cerioporus squamosus]